MIHPPCFIQSLQALAPGATHVLQGVTARGHGSFHPRVFRLARRRQRTKAAGGETAVGPLS